MSLFDIILNIGETRTILGLMILLTHHTRVFEFASTFVSPSIRCKVGLFSLLGGSVFLLVAIIVFLRISRWLVRVGSLHRIDF